MMHRLKLTRSAMVTPGAKPPAESRLAVLGGCYSPPEAGTDNLRYCKNCLAITIDPHYHQICHFKWRPVRQRWTGNDVRPGPRSRVTEALRIGRFPNSASDWRCNCGGCLR